MTRHLALLVVAAALSAGCDLDLERMIDQPRFASYEACAACPGGTIMMQPPDGTVPRGAPVLPDEVARGRAGDAYVDVIPVEIDRRTLARGRNRFDIYCAACHGRLATGVSQVAENMSLRAPPDLTAEPYRSYPPGRVFTVITEGFGLMRSYADVLPPGDRWAVVAYLEALRLSQAVPIDDLPPAVRQEARPWLR